MEEPSRLEVRFSGWVQGVGFRYTVQRLSAGFAVTGYVKNLDDGRVELVCEGERSELERFYKSILAKMEGYIESVDLNWSEAKNEFTGFKIRF